MGEIVKKKPTVWSAEEKEGRRIAKVFASFFVPNKKYEHEFYFDVVRYGPFTAIYNQGWLYGSESAMRKLSRD